MLQLFGTMLRDPFVGTCSEIAVLLPLILVLWDAAVWFGIRVVVLPGLLLCRLWLLPLVLWRSAVWFAILVGLRGLRPRLLLPLILRNRMVLSGGGIELPRRLLRWLRVSGIGLWLATTGPAYRLRILTWCAGVAGLMVARLRALRSLNRASAMVRGRCVAGIMHFRAVAELAVLAGYPAVRTTCGGAGTRR